MGTTISHRVIWGLYRVYLQNDPYSSPQYKSLGRRRSSNMGERPVSYIGGLPLHPPRSSKAQLKTQPSRLSPQAV